MENGPLSRLSRLPPAVWIGLILIVAALARCLFPQADPPLRMGGSGGIFSDEGAFTNNARNLLLFGRAFMDEWNSYQYTPVLHILQLPVFYVFGVGLLQERLIPMAFGIATVWLLFLFAARAWGREAGYYAAFFLSTSYFTIVHNRLGLVETPQVFIMVLAVVLWQRARDDRPAFVAASGIAVALVVITKSLGLWFVAAFYTAAAAEVILAPSGGRKAPLWRLTLSLLAAGTTMGLWYLLFYLQNREDLLRFGAAYKQLSIPANPARLLRNLQNLPFLNYYRPEWVALGVSLLTVTGLLLRSGRREIRDRSEVWIMALWFLAGVLALDILSYTPTRYFVPLAPAIAALAGWGLATFRRPAPERLASAAAPFGLAAAWLWLTLAVKYLPLTAIARRWPETVLSQNRTQWALAATGAAALLGLVFLGRRFCARLPPNRSLAIRTALVALVLLGSLTQNWQQYLAWASERRYTVLETSRELAPIVDGGLLAGLFSPVLSLENRARVLYALEPWCNYERTFERFPVTHLILGEFNREPSWWWRRYPEQMRRAIPLRVYHIWRTNLYFLSMREQDRGVFNRMRNDRGGPLDAEVVAATAPGEMLAGAADEGSITFRNSGSDPWTTADVTLGVVAGKAFGPTRIPLPPGTTVRPGESVAIAVPYQAPANTGYFMLEWRLQDDSGRWFGDSIPQGILVRGPGGEI